jgi:hypothetical protein
LKRLQRRGASFATVEMMEMVAMAAAVTVAVLAEMEGAKAVPEATAEATAEAREAGTQAVAKAEMAHIAHVSSRW